MNRFGAFAIHLGISLLIFAGLAYLVLFHWYPDFFFASDGGWQGMRIIVFVDLVLGPLLTLIVFNTRKPRSELRRDLGIIAGIQLSCLVAGTWVVFQSRPIALVYVDGNFYSMTRGAYQELGVPVPDLARFPGPWPKRVTVALPEDPLEQSQVRRQALESRTPLRALTALYEPFSFEDLALDEAFDVAALRRGMQHPEQLDAWLDGHESPAADYAFFYYGTRYGFTLLGVSRSRETFLGILGDPLDADA